jgi:hypothetical protein
VAKRDKSMEQADGIVPPDAAEQAATMDKVEAEVKDIHAQSKADTAANAAARRRTAKVHTNGHSVAADAKMAETLRAERDQPAPAPDAPQDAPPRRKRQPTPEEVAHLIEQTLRALFDPEQVFEVRVPEMADGRTASGYFNDITKAVTAIQKLDGTVPAIYVTLNRLPPEMLGRANNRVRVGKQAQPATADDEVLWRDHLLLDFDPQRLSGISASVTEHDASLQRVKDVARVLATEHGWPDPLVGDSGNGGHLVYDLDLPNDEPSRVRVEQVLRALAARFNDPAGASPRITLDTGVFNASRITKAYGTIAAKGDVLPDRRHRRSHLLRVPDVRVPVTVAQMDAVIAAYLPAGPSGAAGAAGAGTRAEGSGPSATGTSPARDFLARHGLAVAYVKTGRQGQTLYILRQCVFDPSHMRGSAAVQEWPSGALGYKCFHAHCADKTWADVRALLEPEPASGRGTGATTGKVAFDWRAAHQSAEALRQKDITHPPFVVPGIVPHGTTLLGGRPKAGKTTLTMQISYAVAEEHGTVLGVRLDQQGDVLLLALEDTEERLQRRFRQMFPNARAWPRRLYVHYVWPTLAQGGLDYLEEVMDAYANLALIAIDSWPLFRGPVAGKGGYSQDYTDMDRVSARVRRRSASLLLTTHTTKTKSQQDGEEIDFIQDTTGITAGVDTVLVMKRVEGVMTLFRKGRDFADDAPIKLAGNPETLLWTPDASLTGRSAKDGVLMALSATDVPMGPAALGRTIGFGLSAMKMALMRMAQERPALVRVTTSKGEYALTKAGQTEANAMREGFLR